MEIKIKFRGHNLILWDFCIINDEPDYHFNTGSELLNELLYDHVNEIDKLGLDAFQEFLECFSDGESEPFTDKVRRKRLIDNVINIGDRK